MSRTKTPVRICISSERYEIAANLFNGTFYNSRTTDTNVNHCICLCYS